MRAYCTVGGVSYTLAMVRFEDMSLMRKKKIFGIPMWFDEIGRVFPFPEKGMKVELWGNM